MKHTLIVILILAVTGLGYFALKPKPIVVPTIPDSHTSQPAQTQNQTTSTTTPSQTTVTSSVATKLPTYIGGQEGWPPVITYSTTAYSCSPTHSQNLDIIQKVINGKTYCINIVNEGTAGTMYYTYTYTLALGTGTKTTHFILGYHDINCEVNGTAENILCHANQPGFNADAAVSNLMTNTTVPSTSMTDWKTYTNTQYGFSFQYPSDSSYKYITFQAPTVITNPEASNIDSNGCYIIIATAADGLPLGTNADKTSTINGISYCHSGYTDGGAGMFGGEYAYTTHRNGMYLTFDYKLGFHNNCEGANNLCRQEISDSGINNVIQQSVATLTFK